MTVIPSGAEGSLFQKKILI